MEIWKDVSNYEGLYQVSNLGRVKSLERKVKHWQGGLKTVKEKIKVGYVSTSGYIVMQLSSKGVNKTFTIHQLVAMAFLNHKPCGYKIVIDHIDDDKTNNKLSNIRLVDQKENIHKSIRRGRFKCKGSDNGNSKLTEECVLKIRRLDREGVKRFRIADMMSVSRTTISDICNYKIWNHI